MQVIFKHQFLADIYSKDDGDKKHRYQPQIIKRYIDIVNLMIKLDNVLQLTNYKSLHYEKLVGDKMGFSSVRINDQYRIEFEEMTINGELLATVCNITDLSNHYD